MCSIKDQSAIRKNAKNRGVVFYGFSFSNVSFRSCLRFCCFCCVFFLNSSLSYSAVIGSKSGSWTTLNLKYSALLSDKEQPDKLSWWMANESRPYFEEAYRRSWGNYPHKIVVFKCYEYYRDLDEKGCFIHDDGNKYCHSYPELVQYYGKDVFKKVRRVFTRVYGTCSNDPNFPIGWCTPYDEEGYLSCGGELLYTTTFYAVKGDCGINPFYVTDKRTFKMMLHDVSTNASQSNFKQALDKIKGSFTNVSTCPTWQITIPPLFGHSTNMVFTIDFFCWDFFINVYRLSGYILILLSTYFAIRIALD